MMPAWSWLEQFELDVRYAIRSFARTPAFTAIAILLLSIGIGATTAIFSVVNSVLLHPLPYPNAERLVVIWEKLTQDPKAPPIFDSYRDFQAWKRNSRSFDQLAPATWATGGQILTGAGPARQILAMPVGIDFFSLLGIPAEIGRTFQSDDLHSGCTVVLRHRFWMTAFAGHSSVIGKHISLNQTPCTVAGVMPERFTFFPEAAPMWMLISRDNKIERDPEHANVGVFGRLKRGVSLVQAQEELEILYKNEHRSDKEGLLRAPVIHPLAEQFAFLTGPNLRLSISVLFAAVVCVLLIVCINLANLFLGRSLARGRELAVRAALGSGRSRVIRQLLTEALLLSGAGTSVGILFAIGAVHYFRKVNPIEMPPGNPVTVNLPVLGFAVLLAMVTAVGFALIPAFQASRIDMTEALKAHGRSASAGITAGRFTKALVIGEVTLSLALLVGAGLLIASFRRFTSVPLGYQTDRVLTMAIELPGWSYPSGAKRAKFFREALNLASTLPGVESSAIASSLPLNNARWGGSAVVVEGRADPASAVAIRDVAKVSITPDYFRVMNVALKRGSLFQGTERADGEPIAIVNEALVRKYLPHGDAIGKRIKVGEPGTDRPWLRITGITADEKDRNFFHEMTWQDIPTVFVPVVQGAPASASLVIRTVWDNVKIGAALEKQISQLDSAVPLSDLETLDERLSRSLAYPQFRAAVLAAFAGMSLLLAGLGLYGVLSQFVLHRTQEFGVRMALGAQVRDVVTLVVRQGMLLTILGVAAGLAASLLMMRFISSLLFRVKATDPAMLAAVILVQLAVAFLALLIPARRAAKADPMIALKYE